MNVGKQRKGWKLFILEGLLILGISFVLAEITLRIYQNLNPTFIFYADSYNRFRGRPFAPVWNFQLNSKGFNDKEFLEKKPGIYRIIGIGDSFAFGVVPYQNNYLTLLESKLQEKSINVEVLNLGIPAIGPKDYVTVLVHEGLALKPDMLLLSFFVGNDIADIPSIKIEKYSYVISFFSYIMKLMRSYEGPIVETAINIESKEDSRDQRDYCDDCPTFNEETFLGIEKDRSSIFLEGNERLEYQLDKVVFYLKKIRAICQEKGIELALVLIPDELQVNAELRKSVIEKYYPHLEEGLWNDRLPNIRLTMRLHELNIKYLDLYEYFAERSTERLYKPRDTHWNIAGNNLAANTIQDYLLRHYRKHME